MKEAAERATSVHKSAESLPRFVVFCGAPSAAQVILFLLRLAVLAVDEFRSVLEARLRVTRQASGLQGELKAKEKLLWFLFLPSALERFAAFCFFLDQNLHTLQNIDLAKLRFQSVLVVPMAGFIENSENFLSLTMGFLSLAKLSIQAVLFGGGERLVKLQAHLVQCAQYILQWLLRLFHGL